MERGNQQVSKLTTSSSQNSLMSSQAASSSQNSMTGGCGSGESILSTGGTEGIPRSDLTCWGGAVSSYLVEPTSTGLLDGKSLKPASRDGYTCCVSGNNTKNNRELSFYKFPREKVTRDKWINAIKRKTFIPNDHHLVCSQHFKGGKKVAHVIFLQ